MSTILKALKQSEARRRRAGPLPAGETSLKPSAAPARRRLQWLAALLLLGAGAGTGWYLAGGADEKPATRRETRIAQASLPERRPSAARERAETAPSDRAKPAGKTTGNVDPGSGPGKEEKKPAPPMPAARKVSAPRGAEPQSTPEASAGPETATPDDGKPVRNRPAADNEGSQTEAEPAPGKYVLLPRWRDLPQSRRQALSPLTLNAHVYAPDPADRFVLINLSRFGEGDQVRPGLRVAAIYPGGVVLDDGQGEFVIPRP